MLATASSRPGRTRRWRPRWTLRLRLTLLYGGLFLAAGTALLAITYGLVAGDTAMRTGTAKSSVLITRKGLTSGQLPTFPTSIIGSAGGSTKIPPDAVFQARSGSSPAQARGGRPSGTVTVAPGGQAMVVQLLDYAGQVAAYKQLTAAQAGQLRAQQQRATLEFESLRNSQLDTLLTRSGLALAIMALASIGLGWLMAGRALRPVRTMSSRARGISERNLHERLALGGPDDELKELGDTFDGLLGRLEAAFDSQRRFVANASHELRTPITLERALVEVALSDPNPSVESLRETCRRVLTSSEQQERLIEALLTLARSQRGLESRAPVDLREVTAEVVRAVPSNGIKIDTELRDASTTGDPAMVERLIANLVQNAVRYNQPDGWVTAWTGVRDGEPTVEVTNTGPVVASDQLDELVKPFSRLDGNGSVAARSADGREGLGLGLSIVQAIVDAHGARLTTDPRAEGGLKVAVSFPRVG
ncbi:MAG TPA: ATP-binding protein [Solirubrobacteraceae bacterium]|nr:ATP-binding protein [Solirubrobacteraceae bacterium]